jgi:lysyl-tRNA synthetase class II
MKAKLALIFALLGIAVAAYAHHSFAATYDESKTIEIKGRIVVFQFRNPHSFVTVEVTEGTRKVRWGVEGPGSTQLANSNIQNDTLRYGDEVVVTGNPSRTPDEKKLRLRTMKRPDGFSFGFTDQERKATEQ